MRSDYTNLPDRASLNASKTEPKEKFTEGSPDLASITRAMRSADFELDANEAAAVLAAVAEAQANGYTFDPFTLALVDVLRRQLAETDDGFEDAFDSADFEDDRDFIPDAEGVAA